MRRLRQIKKSNPKGHILFFCFFLLSSFFIQTSLPRFVTVHHHEGGTEEHRHVGFQFKSLADHHPDSQKKTVVRRTQPLDLNKGEAGFQSASNKTWHDHHNRFFLGEFSPEHSLKTDILSFRRHDTRRSQSVRAADRLAPSVRGPPLAALDFTFYI